MKPFKDERAVGPLEALRRLQEGNARFANELTSMRARMTATREWRAHLADGQAPFATIVSCSDSRVPAELIFDQGLGDLFIVRNAGTAIGPVSLASIEFAVAKLDMRLVLVLVHENCGAFRAAREILEGGESISESMSELVARLKPAMEAANHIGGTPDERCERAAEIHARMVAGKISESPVVKPRLRAGAILVVPARYHLAKGIVEFLDPVPQPKEAHPLLQASRDNAEASPS